MPAKRWLIFHSPHDRESEDSDKDSNNSNKQWRQKREGKTNQPSGNGYGSTHQAERSPSSFCSPAICLSGVQADPV
jgi:hypothetical protein